jgi:hypothetical protein
VKAAERDLSSVRRRIRLARWIRVLAATSVAIDAAGCVEWAAARQPAPELLTAFTAAFMTANVLLQTVNIRRWRREEARLLHETRPRPDYAAIAAMETEIWGRAFGHAGAPETAPAPRRYTTWNEDGERFCPWCPDEGCWQTCAGRSHDWQKERP